MEPMRFFLRVVAVIVGVVTFHILGIEFLIFFVMAPTLSEFGKMLIAPLPIAVPLVGTYIVITYYYVRPIPASRRKLTENRPRLISDRIARSIPAIANSGWSCHEQSAGVLSEARSAEREDRFDNACYSG